MAVKTVSVSIKISPEEKKMIQELAASKDVTVSKLLYNYLFKEQKILDKRD